MEGRLAERMWASMESFDRLIAASSPGAELVRLPDVAATVVPAAPQRSVFNSVLYANAGALAAALEELERRYRRAGIGAWTVWVHPGDRRAAELLAAAGHRLDATPAAMARWLDDPPPELPLEATWTRSGSVGEMAWLNDLAYGWEEDQPFARVFAELDPDAAHVYVAHRGGEPACTLLVHDHDGDACVWSVATGAEHRGRGLASGLLARALTDARERGCASTSLQATKLGEPVYARLGYRSLGALEMWERREEG